MNTVVIAINPVDYKDPKKKWQQSIALKVLHRTPDWIFPIAFGFEGGFNADPFGIHTLNILKRNSGEEIGNTRDLPYLKEILNLAAKIECGKIGYINSDILIGDDFIDTIKKNAEAFTFSRSDIAETSVNKFLNGQYKVIYGGDKHIGADGFFFNRQWWKENEYLFHDDLILGETEWDTCYRKLIERHSSDYIEKRALYHVYHDAKWNLTSPGAKNNIAIWESIKNR